MHLHYFPFLLLTFSDFGLFNSPRINFSYHVWLQQRSVVIGASIKKMRAGQSSMAPARKHHELPGITGSPLAKWSFHLQLRGKGDLCESVCMCVFAWACLWVLLLSPGNTLWSKWDWNALIRLRNSCCVSASTISERWLKPYLSACPNRSKEHVEVLLSHLLALPGKFAQTRLVM